MLLIVLEASPDIKNDLCSNLQDLLSIRNVRSKIFTSLP